MPTRYIIFDFDGTIANTIEKGREVFNTLAPDYGIRQIEAHEVPELRKLTLPQILKHLNIGKLQVPALLAKGSKLLKSYIPSIPLITGMAEEIPKICSHSKTCGILTSNTQENVQLFLEANNLQDHFTFISSTSKLTGKAKHLRSICRTYSCSPEEILYIGDETRDIKACQKADIPIAAVTWGFNDKEILQAASPNYLIDTPKQLTDLIQNLTQV